MITGPEFATALLEALNNDSVAKKLREVITGELIQEVQYLRKIVKERDSIIQELQEEISELKFKDDALEQYTRRNSLRITDVPENESEDLTSTCLALFNTRICVKPKIRLEDVDRLHRVGRPKPGKTRAILVKFATYRARQRVFSSKSMLKPDGRDPSKPWSMPGPAAQNATLTAALDPLQYPKLTAAGSSSDVPPEDGAHSDVTATSEEAASADDIVPSKADFDGVILTDTIIDAISGRIFINEDLTKMRETMLYHARQAKNNGKITGSWSIDGIIKIKLANGKIASVSSEKELNEIIA